MSNHCNQNSFASQKLQLSSKAMKPKAKFVHCITMVPLTDSMPKFFPEVPLPTQLNQAKKMPNHCNWNCFVSQKLQLFSKAMKSKANFAHYITMAPLTESMPEFFPEVPLSIQLNQAKKMSINQSISLLHQRPPTCKAGLFWQVQDLTRFTHLTRYTHIYT